MSHGKKSGYDLDFVRQAASRRWPEIIASIGRVDRERLNGEHHPCPKCGGTDRFRAFDDGTGGAICNQCFRDKNGDGFATLQWLTGHTFAETLAQVCAYLGISPVEKNGKSKAADPAEHLEFLPWNGLTAAMWCHWKRPISPMAIQAIGGRLARYRRDYNVIAIPVYGEGFRSIVGWTIYNATGGNLPKWTKVGGQLKEEWVKVKLTYGSQPGVMGTVDRIAAASHVWKLEGSTDMLAMVSLDDLPLSVAVLTNANGAKERPANWMVELFRGKTCYVCHDADKPGQDGAAGWRDERGEQRLGWATSLATVATEARNVLLPFAIEETHGKDVRDFLATDQGYHGMMELVANAQPIEQDEALAAKQDSQSSVIEADDDPHRLARMNLERYATTSAGEATIRYWREEWYTWKKTRGCYRKIGERELRAKIGLSIKKEFDRLNIDRQKNGDDDEPPVAKKVTRNLLSNVMEATASTQLVPSHVEAGSLLSADSRAQRRNWIAMRNGILDVDALLAGADEVLQPHTPNWFSNVCLPYVFDPEATCPRWDAFLQKNLEGDAERINILQEWAGYLLLPDTGQQRFMILEGEGANGKSVYCAAMEAMIGGENCSHVPLELFGDRFSKTSTLGKLANISADAGEMEKTAEGFLKSFTAGETMNFDRKGISAIDCYPTARLMIACNNRPRFSDRSDGIWRRLILIPWRIQIQAHERIPNMDKAWFWEQSGELPGIFLWAVEGLHRLRQQGRFSTSEISAEATKDYQEDVNPAKHFLRENLEINTHGMIRSDLIYEIYMEWCEKNGNRPLGERGFGKELRRVFPFVERKRGGGRASRFWFYEKIGFSADEICGKKTSEAVLF